jgi:hypothetical protein
LYPLTLFASGLFQVDRQFCQLIRDPRRKPARLRASRDGDFIIALETQDGEHALIIHHAVDVCPPFLRHEVKPGGRLSPRQGPTLNAVAQNGMWILIVNGVFGGRFLTVTESLGMGSRSGDPSRGASVSAPAYFTPGWQRQAVQEQR